MKKKYKYMGRKRILQLLPRKPKLTLLRILRAT
jgi:hypothetical protein